MHSRRFLDEISEIASLLDASQIEAMVKELVELRKRRGRLFVIGLGGSAANASHAVNDFRKLCGIEAYAPTDNVAELTARMNDEHPRAIFDSYIAWSQASDALMILSVGGGSAHISPAIAVAAEVFHRNGNKVLGIVGRDDGYANRFGDCVIVIPTIEPSRVTPHTESFQSVILHCLVSHPDLQRNACKW